MKAAFTFLPALFLMIGLATFFVGLLPKLKSLVWLLFGYSFLMFYFGRLFKVPEFALKLSPFNNIPQLPVEKFTVLPLVVLCVISVILITAGILGFEKRDIKN